MAIDYEPLDMAEVMTEYERVSAEPGANQGDDFLEKYVKLPERDGYVMLRFLPRRKGQKLVCATRIHTLNNPTTKKKRTYHCPKVLVQTEKGPRWQGECIICKYYSDLWQKSEALSGKAQEDLQNQARDIKPVERYYFNVVVRSEMDKDGNVKKNVGPKIYSCGKTVYAKILRAIKGDESAGEKALGDITHPTNGRDFRVVKKVVKGGGGKEYPNYDNSKFEEPTPAGSMDELQTWLENIHDLQALRQVKSPDELKHALRVHLGMVKEGEAQADDLEEFRNAGQVASAAHTAPAESVREELAVSSIKPEAREEATAKENELLADDDFMKELEGM
jgi:hypothetical protein